ncbi:AAA family ATPase [Algicella marina]|nr:AAA family ATPase [Algicella marina]
MTPSGDGVADQIWRRDNAFRQITAVFVDVADSSGLMQSLGLDDYSDFLGDFQSLVAREAVSHSGYVAEYLGDGVVLYFGYPKVSDEDQINALSCALAILAAARAEKLPFEGLRIGIATGQSILDRGETSGSARRAVGDCLTKAARIQSIAAIDSIAVCATTPTLTRDLFTFSPLGAHELKGFPQPENLFRLTGHRADTRASSPATARLSVGRRQELEEVATAFAAAREGEGKLIVIHGEAGIGKSHFSQNLSARLLPAGQEPALLYCTPITARSSFLPLADCLNALAIRFLPKDLPTRRARLEYLLRHRFAMPPGLDEALLASLLPSALEAAQGGARLNMSGARAAALDILADQMLTLVAQECHSLMLLEDLHWADSGTLEFLQILFAKRHSQSVLLAATTRPEGPLVANGIRGDHLVSLAPLTDVESRDIIAALNPALDPEQLARACASAGGLPLLLEEYAQAFSVDPEAPGPTQGTEVSATVNALVQTKLDRLGVLAQRFVEVGAVIGQRFPLPLAGAIAGLTITQLSGVLAHLHELDLIRSGAVNAASGSVDFKHALISDAIYASIPRKRRALIHNAVAVGYAEAEEAVSKAVIAAHLDRAEKPEEAARVFLAAATEMSNLGDPVQTLAQTTRALACIARLGDTANAKALEIEARALEGLARMVMQGPGSPDFGASAKRALQLCEETGVEAPGQVLFAAGLHSWAVAEFDQADPIIASLQSASTPEQPGLGFAASLLLGLVNWHRGNTETALAAFTTVLESFDLERDDGLYAEYLMDFKTFSGFYSALCHAALGQHDVAKSLTDETLAAAKPLMRPHPIGFAMLARAVTAMFAGDKARTAANAEECIAHSTLFTFPEFIALAEACSGWADLSDDPAAGLNRIRAGREGWSRTGFRSWEALFAALEVAALHRAGDTEAAGSALSSARKLIADRGENQFFRLIEWLDADGRGGEDHGEPATKTISPGFLA